MSQAAFDRIKQVEQDLDSVRRGLQHLLSDPTCKGADRDQFNRSLATSERTYLLRLLAEFEGALTDLGPALSVPVSFSSQVGLSGKLQRIGKAMAMDLAFRRNAERILIGARNALAHGKSIVAPASFDDLSAVTKRFLRGCH